MSESQVLVSQIVIPNPCVVVLIGASGSGKSTFARKNFLGSEILSSDACRALVSDNENDQSATDEAFDLLHYIMDKRLSAMRTCVIDATNVQQQARKPLVRMAKTHDLVAVAIVLNIPMGVCYERNSSRPERQFGSHVIRNHVRELRHSLGTLQREGFRYVHVLNSLEDIEQVEILRQPLWTNKSEESGPFDIIGDIHGCYDELCELLEQLGDDPSRKLVFLGDLVDRGPKSVEVLKLVMQKVEEGRAFCVPGNHDEKLLRKLQGRNVKVTHGLEKTLEQLDKEPPEFHEQVLKFLDGLISHYVLDGGKLVVAHAGMKQEYAGRASGRVREFALFGETTGEVDELGLPERFNWAAEYRGTAKVVYGHTPVYEPEWLNGTINIDTGCVFGGRLSALRYPEMEIVSVPAKHIYAENPRPLSPAGTAMGSQLVLDEVLDIEDVTGKRIVHTSLRGNVTIQEENAAAALEAISRFATHPKWLVYLAPTMSPTETSAKENLLEHPEEGFGYFRHEGVAQVVCEEKHMGSRAVVVLCRDEETAAKRFGVVNDGAGVVLTRTGRRFFDDRQLEGALLERIRKAMDVTGLWERFQTNWVVLDCELMPWSAKAQELLRQQYAAVGAAGGASSEFALHAVQAAAARGLEGLDDLLARLTTKREMVERFVASYRHYCWPVNGLEDLRLAPFHVLATEGQVHSDKNHVWHMQTLHELCAADGGVLFPTPYHVIDLTDESSVQSGIEWWEELTDKGGEGMVIKPMDFVVRGKKGLIQPAVKCRGREYLRIIYGPEYTAPENLSRLRHRGVSRKRSLALREFALGLEALDRFVKREPLRRVHECVFGVLALESEPVDPRL